MIVLIILPYSNKRFSLILSSLFNQSVQHKIKKRSQKRKTCALAVLRRLKSQSRKVNGNGKVILDTHPESDQHQN